jgi:hypothetical protein
MTSILEFTCLYCDFKWTESAYFYSTAKARCPRCNDKNVKSKSKEQSKSDIFGYNRSEPFPDAYVNDPSDWESND